MKYPVICLKPNDTMIYGFRNEKSLKTADKQLTESGIFNNVTIVDAEGDTYLINEAHILGWATPFWGYSLKKPGRQVKIDFRLETKGKYSLDDLKTEIRQRVRQNSYFRESFNWEELENHISTSNTVRQLLSFFS
jgi:hypothetical protein